jgi:hypothetical protein
MTLQLENGALVAFWKQSVTSNMMRSRRRGYSKRRTLNKTDFGQALGQIGRRSLRRQI